MRLFNSRGPGSQSKNISVCEYMLLLFYFAEKFFSSKILGYKVRPFLRL